MNGVRLEMLCTLKARAAAEAGPLAPVRRLVLCACAAPRHVLTCAERGAGRDGTSRQFGFVGFRTVEQAERAVKYFNRTFIGTARVGVEFAEKYGGGGLARPWSKYSEARRARGHRRGPWPLCHARGWEAEVGAAAAIGAALLRGRTGRQGTSRTASCT